MSDWIRSYSQCGEDILLWRVLQNVVKGFYIDIGAFDPNEDSVTRIFYDAGWSGINIEPNPGKLARFSQERPRDLNLGIAVSDRDAEMELNVVGETGLTTLINDIAERHQSNGWPVEKITVHVRRLVDIWDENIPNGQDVHFLKIDVEGAEEAVIRGADWSRHRPWIIVVEALEPNSLRPSYQNWDPLLRKAGYEFANFDGLNRYYVACERSEYIEPLRAPLNFIIDRYVPAAVHEAQDAAARVDTLCSNLQAKLSGTAQELADTKRELSGTAQELADTKRELSGTAQELADTKRELSDTTQDLSQLRDVLQRRPRPLWERMIFRRSGRPKKMFRRILFHKSGKPRGIFRKWIFLPDGRVRAVFHMWMTSPGYLNLRMAAPPSVVTYATPATLSPAAQLVARRVAALRHPSSRK